MKKTLLTVLSILIILLPSYSFATVDILIAGDSIAEGLCGYCGPNAPNDYVYVYSQTCTSCPCGDTTSQIGYWLTYYLGGSHTYYNAGIGATNSSQWVGWIDALLSTHHPTRTYFQIGTNDLGGGITWSAFQTNLNSILAKVTAAGSILIVFELPPNSDLYPSAGAPTTWNSNLHSWGTTNGVPIVSVYTTLVDGVANACPTKYFWSTGSGCPCHPNSDGYKVMGQAAAEALPWDTTPPAVTITQSSPQAINSDTITLTGTTSDAVGVSGNKIRIGSLPDDTHGTVCTGTTTWSCTITGFSSGANIVYISGYDAAGNYTQTANNITVNYPYVYPTINGECGPANGTYSYTTPTANLCSMGTASIVTLANNLYSYSCVGSGGGTTASCSVHQSVDGVCGSANGGSFNSTPTTGLCSVGTASTVSLIDTVYSWTCSPVGQGVAGSCTATLLPENACCAPIAIGSGYAPSITGSGYAPSIITISP